MACEFLWNDPQIVAFNSPILFRSSIPCTRGWVIHEDETGNFILRGANTSNCCNQFAQYQVTFNGNIGVPEGGEVTPIAIAITVNGEPRLTSRAIYVPADTTEAGDYGNVTSTAIIKVLSAIFVTLLIALMLFVTFADGRRLFRGFFPAAENSGKPAVTEKSGTDTNETKADKKR